MSIDFFTLLQINDATFQIGSYTLSWGLETFVQQGVIRDSVSAEEYLRSELESSFLTNELLPVRLAFEAAERGDAETLSGIDEAYNASRSARELRDGSRKIAARFQKTVSVWQSNPLRENLFRHVTHYPVAYGAYCASCGIQEDLALQAFLYSQVSARVTTVVKLVPLSQLDGQNILHHLLAEFPRLLEEVASLEEGDMCRSSPSAEMRAMQHEFLYTRLYMS